MSKSSIVRGLAARSVVKTPQTVSDMGGFLTGAGMTGMGLTPVANQYEGWMQGRPYGAPLPRSVEDFMAAAFGPLSPLVPVGVDTPNDESGRPEPRRMQYPVGWNMPIGQPGTEGLKLVSFANLRAYADTYSVVRAAIQVRKEEILGLEWDISPTDSSEKSMRADPTAHADFQSRRSEALKFFQKPDGNYHDFQTWLSAILEDLFVVDSLTVYIHPSRVPGRGLLGSDIAALEALDGTTIRPLMDVRGGKPRPPAPAYQQYLYGVPRVDMMDVILESDLEYMDEPVAQYRADQLLYMPYTRRTWTPYGFPGIERCILPVATGLKKQQWALEFYTEGTIPGLFVTPGPDVNTPQQWRQLQDTLNSLAGDTAYKHRIIVLPPGSTTSPQKNPALADQFDEQIMVQVLMAYDVMPMELGISPKVSATQSPGAANQMAKASADINQRKGLKPILMWLKRSLFDFVLQDLCGQTDMQWKWRGLDDNEEADVEAAALQTMISLGIKSVDESRVEMGLNPWGLPLTSDPVWIGPQGPVPFGSIVPGTDPGVTGQPIATTVEQSSAPQAMGTNAALAPAPAAPAPAPPSGVTPLHQQTVAPSPGSLKNVQQELRQLRRYLRKGRSIASFKPRQIPRELWHDILIKAHTSDPMSAARIIVKGASRLATRDAVVKPVMSTIQSQLQAATVSLATGKITKPQFAASVNGLLQAQYSTAYDQALQDAADDAGIPVEDLEDVDDYTFDGNDLEDYVNGLADDAAGWDEAEAESPAAKNRYGLYAAGALTAYEKGYGAGVKAGPSGSGNGALGAGAGADSTKIIWRATGDTADCDQCDARDGEEYTFDTLPGYPGDGGFGDLCDGGPNCRCWLDYVPASGAGAQDDTGGDELDIAASAKPDLVKDISLSSPLGSGFVPFDLQGSRKPKDNGEDDEDEPLVTYVGLHPLAVKKLAVGNVLTDIDELVSSKYVDPVMSAARVVKIVDSLRDAPEVNGFVTYPPGTRFKVTDVTEGHVTLRVE